MRKRLVRENSSEHHVPDHCWLNIDALASVELTSEAAAYPIEQALIPGNECGWRADRPGEQSIRLLFDQPQDINRIWLSFKEPDLDRTHEFVLRWSSDQGKTYTEIVRQQWNFCPTGAIREVEDYRVNLSGVTILELMIIPDISGGEAHASLAQLRLA